MCSLLVRSVPEAVQQRGQHAAPHERARAGAAAPLHVLRGAARLRARRAARAPRAQVAPARVPRAAAARAPRAGECRATRYTVHVIYLQRVTVDE